LTHVKPDYIQKQRIKATGTTKREKKETCSITDFTRFDINGLDIKDNQNSSNMDFMSIRK